MSPLDLPVFDAASINFFGITEISRRTRYSRSHKTDEGEKRRCQPIALRISSKFEASKFEKRIEKWSYKIFRSLDMCTYVAIHGAALNPQINKFLVIYVTAHLECPNVRCVFKLV